MSYRSLKSDLKYKLDSSLEFIVGFSTSFFMVGSSHLITPTTVRKVWNSYNDEEIHKYIPIFESGLRAKGHVIGAIGGIISWTLQYGTLVYLAKNGESNYHLLPLIPNFLSGVWEINRIRKNRKRKP